MPWTDMPVAELREFPRVVGPASDVREFWADRLAVARAAEQPVTRTPSTLR